MIILTVITNCDRESDREMIERMEAMEVGNGITLHPKQKLLLISKPSARVDSVNNRPYYSIYLSFYRSDNWSTPEEIPFSIHFNNYHPVFSPNGEWLYFNSDRPAPGSSVQETTMNIWRVRYGKGIWSEPEFLPDINTEYHESYPTLTADGTLYFNSDRPGGKGSMDIYRAKAKGNGFGIPENVRELNTSDSENDLFITPEENLLLLNRYTFKTKEVDLFYAIKVGREWSEPRPLQVLNQTGIWELTPTISPKGQYFLYEIDGEIRVVPLEKVIPGQKQF